MTDRARVVVSVTASVDGRVTLGRDRLLLSEEAGSIWRSIWPTGADAASAARTALLEELYAPTAILEGSGTFVTPDAGPLDLPPADHVELYEDYLPAVPPNHRKWFTIVDSRGRVHWDMKGGDGTDLLLLVARTTPASHLSYLRRETIPYLVAGEDRVDLSLALQRMRDVLGVTCVISEAGGGLNGALLRADLIDELHLVLLPTAIGGASVPSIFDGSELLPDTLPTALHLLSTNTTPDGVLSLRYEVIR
ncbi:dihydrofolate reductase family protein [Kribbella sp. NBC_01510]|uniref:RibD family protein n=1 Tax=Kribbella sp. NBC_01510 TaxID=2903581 RepID=UPI0038653C84